ncbi:DNA polymerase III subunit delta [Oceanobacter sp. RED65]|uniref:DNA polymerase III subunit delta n=1 Tax=Bermanella marisrubri TaxID=207949 RepID=Q1MZJ3_9GAMM|nr:DNA polymerase III subunit delta [Oceanobacter sp. RED65] [Bermanella marisrubri]
MHYFRVSLVTTGLVHIMYAGFAKAITECVQVGQKGQKKCESVEGFLD